MTLTCKVGKDEPASSGESRDKTVHLWLEGGYVLWTVVPFTFSPFTLAVIVESLSHVRLLCDPMDCSPLGFSVHGIFQARILEYVTVSCSPRDRPSPGIKPALAGGFFITESPGGRLALLAFRVDSVDPVLRTLGFATLLHMLKWSFKFTQSLIFHLLNLNLS